MNNETISIIAGAAVGLGVCGAVAVGIKETKSAWPLLGLIFIPATKMVVESVVD